MPVADILRSKGSAVFSITSKAPVSEAISMLHTNHIGALVVLDEKAEAVGIISERDVARGLAEKGERILGLKVADLMSRHIHVCTPRDSVKDVMTWMTEYRIRHLPVVEDGKLRGLISIGDVVKYRLSEVQTEANVLRDIVISGT